MPAQRKLPKPARLRYLYVERNQSVASLAAEYGVHYRTVLKTLRADAERDGIPWPLKQNGTGQFARCKTEAIYAGRDEVVTLLVAAEVREALATFGLSQHAFAALSGVSQGQISRLLRPGTRCKRSTASKIEKAIRSLERSAAISAANIRRHAEA